jgi:hypothetical protein
LADAEDTAQRARENRPPRPSVEKAHPPPSLEYRGRIPQPRRAPVCGFVVVVVVASFVCCSRW